MNPFTRISLAAALLLLAGVAAPAQAQVNVNISAPAWGPAVGPNTQYYYIPEVDGYYDVRDRVYVVQRNGRWTRLANAGYNPRTFHPVVVDYVGVQPWTRIEEYRTKYKGHPHGMPPGQAKKYYGRNNDDRRGHDYDDDRYEGHGKGHDKGKGKGKH
ncbi:hypothetical protein SAMN02745146_2920 [Hymenobacter daecheongensis DSM 21074]|uniref:YXWGXW repeat-containing protein n=1 Tax=Hymenobacter daecheongensis DSM 21074 TaxID=1121955 RepID=A0A1M6IP94_9BACT|nr:hypothetical protein [Hymenobacter daecheongensis]SHJ36262.1 hypothetical protein SAMN02745146_2920 [Hymenobacter daecheongensis DSM 21074]